MTRKISLIGKYLQTDENLSLSLSNLKSYGSLTCRVGMRTVGSKLTVFLRWFGAVSRWLGMQILAHRCKRCSYFMV